MSVEANTSAAPLRLWRGTVISDWLDYNGHMTEHRYLQVFGENSDCLYSTLGVDFERPGEGAFYTLQTRLAHFAECRVDTPLQTETEVLGFDEKKLHLYHRLFDGSGRLLATGEHLSVHVRASKACGMRPAMLAHVTRLFEAQLSLDIPVEIGSVLRRPLAHRRPKLEAAECCSRSFPETATHPEREF